MHTASLFGSLFAAILFATSGLAFAQTGGDANPNVNRNGTDTWHPTGMTGHYRNWSQNRSSGVGANNFVGNNHQPGHGDNRWASNQANDNR